MPKLGFPNYFIVNNRKENFALLLPTKGCVILWLRHLFGSMRSWVQTWVVHEFVYYRWCICVHMV